MPPSACHLPTLMTTPIHDLHPTGHPGLPHIPCLCPHAAMVSLFSCCHIWVWSRLKLSAPNSMKHSSQSRVRCLADPLTWLDSTRCPLDSGYKLACSLSCGNTTSKTRVQPVTSGSNKRHMWLCNDVYLNITYVTVFWSCHLVVRAAAMFSRNRWSSNTMWF